MRITLFFFVGLGLTIPLFAREFFTESVALERSVEKPLSVASDEENVTPADSVANRVAQSKKNLFLDTGLQYAEEGEYEEAERAYLRALRADPDDSTIRFRLSTLYIQMEHYGAAVPILEELVIEHPYSHQIRNNLSWCYSMGIGIKNKKKALRHAREALLSAPISPPVWNTLAEAYYMAGDYEKALRSSDRAIELIIQSDPEQTHLSAFQVQHTKIQRAADAAEMMDTLKKQRATEALNMFEGNELVE